MWVAACFLGVRGEGRGQPGPACRQCHQPPVGRLGISAPPPLLLPTPPPSTPQVHGKIGEVGDGGREGLICQEALRGDNANLS